MGNQKLDLENKRIGAYIRADSGKQIDWYLSMLNRFQRDTGIKKVDTYYVEQEEESVEYKRLVVDIFEENIDALLVAGGVERLYIAPNLVEKIKEKIAVIEVNWN